jgi:hypothetical protein
MVALGMDVGPTGVDPVRNSTYDSPSCARLTVAIPVQATDTRAVAARLQATAPHAADTVAGVRARPAEVHARLAEVVVTRVGAAVDIPAVAEATAAAAIAKQVYDWQVDVKTKVK